MRNKIIIIIVILVLSAALTIGGYIAWTTRNTAKSEAVSVLSTFAEATNSVWYCENGYGIGINNSTPWWEQIFLSNLPLGDTVNKVETYLEDRDYNISKTFIENSEDSYNKGKTYWELQGDNGNYSVDARLSANELTLNNCFEDFSSMDSSLDPENYSSVIVIKFRDNL